MGVQWTLGHVVDMHACEYSGLVPYRISGFQSIHVCLVYNELDEGQ